VLSTAAADFFVLTPRFTFYVADPKEVADLLVFGPLAFCLVIVITQIRSAIERERAEADRDHLQLALDAAQLGWWQYDAFHRDFSWDERFKQILDVPANGAAVEEFMGWVHPEDEGRVWARLIAALNPTRPRSPGIEFRITRQGDGEVRWVETLSLPYFEGETADQRAVKVLSRQVDWTQLRQGDACKRGRARCLLGH
jgi:PAS domain-containing protein